MRSILQSRGPWALALILALALQTTFADPDHHGDHGDDDKKPEQEHKDEDYQKLSKRLDTITARLKHIDFHLEKRLSPKIRQKALSLEHRLEELEDDHCDKEHYDCGGQDHECISRLMVCDGHRDCRNGDDEKHCSLPTNTGDRFVGYKVYDNCDEGHMDKATLTITEVKVRPAYPAFPYIRAVISSADEKGDHVEIAYHMVGYYRFSTHKLVLLPPQGSQGGESTGVVCEFDGHDPDKCVAHVVNQVSLSRCAEFVFFRQKGKKGSKRHH